VGATVGRGVLGVGVGVGEGVGVGDEPGGGDAPGVGVVPGVEPGLDALGRGVDRGVPRGGSEMTVEPPVPVASGRGDPGTDGPGGVAAVPLAPGLGCGVTVGIASPDPATVPKDSSTAATTADEPGVPTIPSTSPVGVGGQTATARRTIAAIPAAAADVSRSSRSRATGMAAARGNRCTAPTGTRVTPAGTDAGLRVGGVTRGAALGAARAAIGCRVAPATPIR
jgi:hypothetical protein